MVILTQSSCFFLHNPSHQTVAEPRVAQCVPACINICAVMICNYLIILYFYSVYAKEQANVFNVDYKHTATGWLTDWWLFLLPSSILVRTEGAGFRFELFTTWRCSSFFFLCILFYFLAPFRLRPRWPQAFWFRGRSSLADRRSSVWGMNMLS